MAADTGFEILGGRTVAETPFVLVEELDLGTPGGQLAKRTVVRIGSAVAVVPVLADHVVLIRQYRTPVDKAVLELPAGKLDVPGEDPRDAARRELEEEIGYRAGQLEFLTEFHTSPGYLDEQVTIFLASDLTPVAANPIGPGEVAAELVRIRIDDLPELLTSVEDAKTLIGLMAFLRRIEQEDAGR